MGGGPKWIRMWSSKMESEAGKIESQPIRRYQLVCCDVGEMQGSKALPCGPCGETVWSEVSSSTTTFGMIWFLCCICCCLPCSFLPFWQKNFKKFHHKYSNYESIGFPHFQLWRQAIA